MLTQNLLPIKVRNDGYLSGPKPPKNWNFGIKAAVNVNEQMGRFYWILSRDISSMNSTARYGTDFYSNVSKDLTELLPVVKSFLVTNLRYMG